MTRKKRQEPYGQLKLPLFSAECQKPQQARQLAVFPLKKARSSMLDKRYFSTVKVLHRLGLSITKDKYLYLATRNELYQARCEDKEFVCGRYRVRAVKSENGEYIRNKWEMFEQLTPRGDAA